MALPDPIQPPDAASSPGSAARDARPDWLLGADADPEAEGRLEDRPHDPPPMLRQPGAEGNAPGPSAGPTLRPRPVAWTAAASSVPQLKLVREPPRTEPFGSFTAEEENDERPKAEFPADPEAPIEAADRPEPPGSKLRPLYEPWWIVWLEALATRRRLQISVLAAVLLAALFFFWPRAAGHGVSIASLKRHAETFNGQTVRVRGKIGEVFAVGQGYAFDLHQGRDTVVVFSQTRTPRVHERVEVVGLVSTGYLDGMPRIAVFEEAGPAGSPSNP